MIVCSECGFTVPNHSEENRRLMRWHNCKKQAKWVDDMNKDAIKRFGGSWVVIVEDGMLYNTGWLKAIIGNVVILSNRRRNRSEEKIPGEKAISMSRITSIENFK